MWMSFSLATIAALLLLVLPGWMILRIIGFDRAWSAVLAPLASATLFAILSLAFCRLGIACTYATEALVPFVIAAVLFFATRKRRRAIRLPELSWKVLAGTLVLGLGVGFVVFVKTLPAPDAMMQHWDLQTHINETQLFVQTQRFDSLSYAYEPSPFDGGGFYPATWHAVAAMVVQLSGCSVPVAINALNYVLAAAMYPVALSAWTSLLFHGSKRMQLAGAIAGCTTNPFPWRFLVFGPVFPNLMGFALVPAALVIFMAIADDGRALRERGLLAVLGLLSLVGLLFIQPNAVFTIALFLIVYYAVRMRQSQACIKAGSLTITHVPLIICWLAFCAVVWTVCYHLPLMHDVTSVDWYPFLSKTQALAEVLVFSYASSPVAMNMAQILPGIFLIAGIIRTVRERHHRWLIIAYGLAAGFYVVCVTMTGELKHLLTGFWYTDPYRMAAMAAIFGAPLIAFGIEWSFGLFEALLVGKPEGSHARRAEVSARPVWPVIVGALIIVGIQTLPGTPIDIRGYLHVNGSFSQFRDWVRDNYGAKDEILDPAEQRFCDRVAAEIGTDAVVINNPTDGSLFAYGNSAVHTYYRYINGYGTDQESRDSKAVRTRLNDLATDAEVQQAVKDIGARYVMVLNSTNVEKVRDVYPTAHYQPSDWYGITSINVTTPGFHLVMSEGPCRLYQIDDQYTK